MAIDGVYQFKDEQKSGALVIGRYDPNGRLLFHDLSSMLGDFFAAKEIDPTSPVWQPNGDYVYGMVCHGHHIGNVVVKALPNTGQRRRYDPSQRSAGFDFPEAPRTFYEGKFQVFFNVYYGKGDSSAAEVSRRSRDQFVSFAQRNINERKRTIENRL